MPSGTTAGCYMNWKNNKEKLLQFCDAKSFSLYFNENENDREKCSWQSQIGLNWKEMAAAQ